MRFIAFTVYVLILFWINLYIDITLPMAAAGVTFTGWLFAIFITAAIFPDKDWK